MKTLTKLTFSLLLVLTVVAAVCAEVQFKYGASGNLPATMPTGVPAWTTDTEKLYIGTGTGRKEVGGGSYLTTTGRVPYANYSATIRSHTLLLTGVNTTAADGTHMVAVGNTGNYTGPRAKGTVFHNMSTMNFCEKDNDCQRFVTRQQFDQLLTAVTAAGIDTTPPVLTRVTPSGATSSSTTNSYTIKYTATDAQGMHATHPLQYKIGTGSYVDFTGGQDTALTGFTANTPTTVEVMAQNAANVSTKDYTEFTYVVTDPYTTAFSSHWDGTGMNDTGGTGTGVPWTTATGEGTYGALDTGRFRVTATTVNVKPIAYVTKTGFPERANVALKATVNMDSLNLGGPSNSFRLFRIGAHYAGIMTDGSSNAAQVVVWVDGTLQTAVNYSFQANTDYVMEFRVNHSTTGTGSYDFLINGVSVKSASNITTAAATASAFYVGPSVIGSANIVSGWHMYFDEASVRYLP